jgi:SAM-dependent methyltransferase
MESAFDVCADAYEAYRPGYPVALFDDLAARFRLSADSVVVDLGAGTGRASAALAARGYQVYAVEPGDEMRAKGTELAKQFNGRLQFIRGAAEQTRLADELADLVIAAQAFHWFDPARALPEAARILKARAGLALFWNNRDHDRNAIAHDLDALIQRVNPKHEIAYRSRPWEQVLAASRLFADVARQTFYHSLSMTADSLAGLFRSVSYVKNVLDAKGLRYFELELRRLVHAHYGDAPFPFVYRVELYTARRL